MEPAGQVWSLNPKRERVSNSIDLRHFLISAQHNSSCSKLSGLSRLSIEHELLIQLEFVCFTTHGAAIFSPAPA